MPLLNYQLFICFRKFFGFGQFPEFEPLRFPQFDLFFHVKYRFTAAVADMNMNWAVLVAVKEKPVSVFLKNRWHGLFVSVSEQQAFANVRTDETRAAGDQKVHDQTLTIRTRAVEYAGHLQTVLTGDLVLFKEFRKLHMPLAFDIVPGLWLVLQRSSYRPRVEEPFLPKRFLPLFPDPPFDSSHILTFVWIIVVVAHVRCTKQPHLLQLLQTLVADTKLAGRDGFGLYFSNSHVAVSF
jgi:hypothetical protein